MKTFNFLFGLLIALFGVLFVVLYPNYKAVFEYTEKKAVAPVRLVKNVRELKKTAAAVYVAQRTAAALKAARRATIAARAWLRASHEFYAQDGDPIRCTGWQFVGYNIAAAVVAVLLSIKY